MSANIYQSSIQIPASAMRRLKDRARELKCSQLDLARIILVLAKENGILPETSPPLESDELRVNFPFKLDADFVADLGGEERARDLLRWAIMEGIEISPFA